MNRCFFNYYQILPVTATRLEYALEYFRTIAIKLPCGDPEIEVPGKPLLISPKHGCHVPKDMYYLGVESGMTSVGLAEPPNPLRSALDDELIRAPHQARTSITDNESTVSPTIIKLNM